MNLNNKGFTLIEVLAVLAILSAIIGIAIPSFTSSLESSKEKKEEDRKARLISAAEMYVTDYKESIYTGMGFSDSCYIKTEVLGEKGYASYDDILESGEIIIFIKPNTYDIVEDGSFFKCVDDITENTAT